MPAAAPKRETGWTPPRAFDLEQTWPWIKPYRRAAIRLHREAVAQPLPPAASKIGGAFLWPSNEAWPFCREREPELESKAQSWEDFREHQREKAKGLPQLTSAESAEARKTFDEMNALMALPVIQLRRVEFPELPWPTGKDIFQLLWCPRVHWEGNGMHDPEEPPRQSPGFVLKWRAERLMGPVLTKPPKPRESPGLTECALHPEEIAEYPQADEFGHDEIQPHLDRLAPRLSARPGGSAMTSPSHRAQSCWATRSGFRVTRRRSVQAAAAGCGC